MHSHQKNPRHRRNGWGFKFLLVGRLQCNLLDPFQLLVLPPSTSATYATSTSIVRQQERRASQSDIHYMVSIMRKAAHQSSVLRQEDGQEWDMGGRGNGERICEEDIYAGVGQGLTYIY